MTSNEEDRVVSRRVVNPTRAEPGDERAYRAADPAPDGEHTGEPSPDDESEPTRSE